MYPSLEGVGAPGWLGFANAWLLGVPADSQDLPLRGSLGCLLTPRGVGAPGWLGFATAWLLGVPADSQGGRRPRVARICHCVAPWGACRLSGAPRWLGIATAWLLGVPAWLPCTRSAWGRRSQLFLKIALIIFESSKVFLS
ncbi:hypothetical protein ACFE04_004228 [Oxalis oulophora]